MISKEEEARLRSNYNTALAKLKNGKVGGSNGLEAEFSKAYHKLALAGLELPLKRKYRAR